MRFLRRINEAWHTEMNAADRFRIWLAWGFIFGAASHVGWVVAHGDPWYYGPAPSWAPWFWYGICLVDLVVFWMLLDNTRIGLTLSVGAMVATLIVNWTQFPTFQFGFNYVLLGLTLFGVIVFVTTPWLWTASRWRLSPKSSEHSAG